MESHWLVNQTMACTSVKRLTPRDDCDRSNGTEHLIAHNPSKGGWSLDWVSFWILSFAVFYTSFFRRRSRRLKAILLYAKECRRKICA